MNEKLRKNLQDAIREFKKIYGDKKPYRNQLHKENNWIYNHFLRHKLLDDYCQKSRRKTLTLMETIEEFKKIYREEKPTRSQLYKENHRIYLHFLRHKLLDDYSQPSRYIKITQQELILPAFHTDLRKKYSNHQLRKMRLRYDNIKRVKLTKIKGQEFIYFRDNPEDRVEAYELINKKYPDYFKYFRWIRAKPILNGTIRQIKPDIVKLENIKKKRRLKVETEDWLEYFNTKTKRNKIKMLEMIDKSVGIEDDETKEEIKNYLKIRRCRWCGVKTKSDLCNECKKYNSKSEMMNYLLELYKR